jgi:hypothetical protein
MFGFVAAEFILQATMINYYDLFLYAYGDIRFKVRG